MKAFLKRTCLHALVGILLTAPALRAEITEWLPLAPDKPLNVDVTKLMRDPQLATLPATATSGEKLYAAWGEHGGSGTTLQVRVAVYQNSGSAEPSWKQVDSKVKAGTTTFTRTAAQGINFDTSAAAWGPRLVVHKGILYATWYEIKTSKSRNGPGIIRVCQYNGDDNNPAWTFIDGGTGAGLNLSSSMDAWNPTAVSFGEQLVVFWSEYSYVRRKVDGDQLRAKAYNPATGGWQWLDGGGAAGLNLDPMGDVWGGRPVIVSATGAQPKLYVSFIERLYSVGKTLLRVKVYQGGSLWKVADGGNGLNLDPSKAVNSQFVAGDGRYIYCAWQENDSAGVGQVRVARYNGSDDDQPLWERLDGGQAAGLNWNPGASVSTFGLQSFNDKIYLHWNELSTTGSNRRVRVWDPVSAQWTWADGGQERSNAHRYDTTGTNGSCFGVFAGHLLLFNQELLPYPQPSLGHILVGIDGSLVP